MLIRFAVMLMMLTTILARQPQPLRDPALSGFERLVRGNESFGRRLLHDVHSATPDRNVVVAPLSLTIMLAAIQMSAAYESAEEIGSAFGWGTAVAGRPLQLQIPARMLLAAFSEVKTAPGVDAVYPPEGVWMTNRVVYRTPQSAKPTRSPTFPLSAGFRSAGEKYFGLTFDDNGDARPRAGRGIPAVGASNDVIISSSMHVATPWRGNTFSTSKPFIGGFTAADGTERRVTMMKSDLEYYRHARTGDFEAAELPCNRGSMIAVLPAPGRSLQAVEAMLAEAPASLDAALKNEPGTVTMPEFHSVFESDVTASLQRFGIRTAFKDLKGLFDIPGSRLSEVRQAVDIQVDRRGIRADAGTVAGAIYGGVLGGSVQPFSLTLDRPFIYLVYEANSDALLFAGAVVDPSIR